jgi:hypothetical protein
VNQTPSTIPGAPVYHEEQHFKQPWLWMLVLIPAALAWWPLIQQIIGGKPVGQHPAPDWLVVVLWLLIGIGLPVLFGVMALFIDVTADSVLIRYRPFFSRVIPLTDVAQVEARTYDAIKEYGGWGVKGWSKEKMVYNVSGNRGAELTLKDGRRLMLGSQRADELAAGIESQLRR